ncbi:MAG: hypothetical protein ACERKD_17705 [Prolixibacteraceae bacterium]
MENQLENSKIPITVGIVGNRDAILTEKHKKQIEKLFNDIDLKYPNIPVTLFSQLAVGADTFVAELFLKLKEKENRHYNLIVPIPYNIEEYKTIQFRTKKQREIFNSLLLKAERFFVLENNDNLKDKKQLYRQGGKFIANSSILLISLWNGTASQIQENRIGGTSEIVQFKIYGTFENEVVNQIFDIEGSLISIHCERKNNKNRIPLQIKNLYADLNGILNDKSIEKALSKIATYNKSSITYNRKASNSIDRLNQIRNFIKSETDKKQKSYNNTILFFFLSGFIFFSMFEVFKHKGLIMWAFWSIITVLLIVIVKYFIAIKLRSHHNYIEGRVLSEALRVQFYWNLFNVNKNTADYILRIHKSEFNWIKHFLQAIYGLTYDINKTRKKNIEFIKNDWIITQIQYFDKKIYKIKKQVKFLDRISFLTLIIGVIGLIGIAYCKFSNPELFEIMPQEFPLSQHYLHIRHLEHRCHIYIIIDSVIFGLSAVSKAYLEKKGYKQIMNQYRMSKNLFTITLNKLNIELNKDIIDNIKEKELDRLLFLAGKEALIETGNWYMIMKEKDPEFEIS